MNIDLSCNNISMIEVTFFEPVQVKSWYCYDLLIRYVFTITSRSIFYFIVPQNVLKMLNLSRNILTEVSSETFSQLKRLHMLDLSFNSIVFLEPGKTAKTA